MPEGQNNENISVGKGILLTLAVLVVLAILVLATQAVGGAVWIVCLGLTAWTSLGTSLKLTNVVSIWVSALIGLGMGYLLAHTQQLGIAALIIPLVFVVLLVFFLIVKRLSFIFNPYSALFLTVSTATGIVLDLKQIVISSVFGFLTIGVIPVLIAKLVNRKKNADNQKINN